MQQQLLLLQHPKYVLQLSRSTCQQLWKLACFLSQHDHAGQLLKEHNEVHKVGVDTIALHPSQALLATGGADRVVKLWPYRCQVRMTASPVEAKTFHD